MYYLRYVYQGKKHVSGDIHEPRQIVLKNADNFTKGHKAAIELGFPFQGDS